MFRLYGLDLIEYLLDYLGQRDFLVRLGHSLAGTIGMTRFREEK